MDQPPAHLNRAAFQDTFRSILWIQAVEPALTYGSDMQRCKG